MQRFPRIQCIAGTHEHTVRLYKAPEGTYQKGSTYQNNSGLDSLWHHTSSLSLIVTLNLPWMMVKMVKGRLVTWKPNVMDWVKGKTSEEIGGDEEMKWDSSRKAKLHSRMWAKKHEKTGMECERQHEDKLLSGFDGLRLNIWCFESVSSTGSGRFLWNRNHSEL